MIAIKDMTQDELRSLLLTEPRAADDLLTGLEATLELVRPVRAFVRSADLTDDEREQLHGGIEEFRASMGEFRAALSMEVAA
jgi:hypothetical protein